MAPKSIRDLERRARKRLSRRAFAYAAGGADDERTLRANVEAFAELGIRCRRLVDVSEIDTSVGAFGHTLDHPILLAPVGFQSMFDPDGELATAVGAVDAGARMIASSVSSHSIGEITRACGTPPWFQLYPTTNRKVTRGLLERAEEAGSEVLVLTVDVPVLGNRERHGDHLARLLAGGERMGNYEGLRGDEPVLDPTMTWDVIDWLRSNCSMKLVLKGIVTREDAELCAAHGVDGVVVSNHGGRQEESGRSTIGSLPEVLDGVAGRLPVWLDGGVRRGTDVFKALALGAEGVCIGRPYVWGLAARGAEGVALAVDILRAELVRTMQLAGTPSVAEITRHHVGPSDGRGA